MSRKSGGRGKGPGSVRIAGGELRGRSVPVPRGARPTEGRVREALFSIWQMALPGCRLLDLFAGSGVVGFEAAGRGALSVVAVEQDRRAFQALEASVAELDLGGLVKLRRGRLPEDLATLAEERPEGFHRVFADPPYAWEDYPALIAAVEPLLAEGGELVVEHDARVELPVEVPAPEIGRVDDGDTPALVRADTRRYGESGLSFYRRVADPLADP